MTEWEHKQLPEAEFIYMDDKGPQSISSSAMTGGKTIVLFALPGAYTPTCSESHLPSYVNNMDALRAKGVDEVYCVTVNDVFVAKAWGDSIDAANKGVHILCDPTSAFTDAMGMSFDGPPVGLYGRSKRYALIAKDGLITYFAVEADPGTCSVSGAEDILSHL